MAVVARSRSTSMSLSSWGSIGRMAGNDFESVVFARLPAVRAAFEALCTTHPLVCRMSGSGSTLFAIYRSARERDDAMMMLGRKHGEVRAVATMSAPRPASTHSHLQPPEVGNQVRLLLRRKPQRHHLVVVRHHGLERRSTSIVKVRRVLHEPAQRRRAIQLVSPCAPRRRDPSRFRLDRAASRRSHR